MLARKALAGTAAAPKVYVEDVFSTYLYTGNGSTQTITNGIDLSGEGGLVWTKSRNLSGGHALIDTVRGTGKQIGSNSTDAEKSANDTITAFNNSGYSLGADSTYGNVNISSSYNYASWTFRKAKKFFDVQTWTGTGTSGRQVAHNLGSVPGCVIIKSTSTAGEPWLVYHRSLGASQQLRLNTTDEASSASEPFDGVDPTSTYITLPSYNGVNGSGKTYVGYFFAHDAGGFGDAGDQSVISCGTFTTDSGEASTTTLGWEPQWLLIKKTSAAQDWYLADNMRGLNVAGQDDYFLYPNLSSAEGNNNRIGLTSTGFTTSGFGASSTFVYIAIRRGPMKTPTTGTSVFAPTTYTGNGTSQTITSPGFAPDMLIGRVKASSTPSLVDKLRGSLNYLYTSNTDGEVGSNSTSDVTAFTNTGFNVGADNRGNWNTSSGSEIVWTFKRAPGFFDVVAYAGTGSAGATTSHNLGVSPELIITKVRNFTGEDWIVHYRNGSTITAGYLNTTAAFAASGSAPSTDLNSFSSTSYTRNTGNRRVNSGSYNYVAYLFASLSGVSSIGTYTGNGSSVTVTTNFQPRFILVKRTDSTGNWIVSDSARGLVAGNDPYLLLNSSAAEDTDEDWVDITSTSFTVNETSASNANTNGGTYLYLAIA